MIFKLFFLYNRLFKAYVFNLFLDPNDLESPRSSVIMGSKFTINQQATPVSPNAEDLSVILGSMQVYVMYIYFNE